MNWHGAAVCFSVRLRLEKEDTSRRRPHTETQADLHSLMSLPHAMWSLGVSVLTTIQYGNLLLIVAFARVVFVV